MVTEKRLTCAGISRSHPQQSSCFNVSPAFQAAVFPPMAYFVQVRGPLLVLGGAPSELVAKIREDLYIRQQPKSFSRIAMVLNCGSRNSHRQLSPVSRRSPNNRRYLFTNCDKFELYRAPLGKIPAAA